MFMLAVGFLEYKEGCAEWGSGEKVSSREVVYAKALATGNPKVGTQVFNIS